MHIRAKRPVFVPATSVAELDKLSKAFLMDVAWDYATQLAGSEIESDVLKELRERIEIVRLTRD